VTVSGCRPLPGGFYHAQVQTPSLFCNNGRTRHFQSTVLKHIVKAMEHCRRRMRELDFPVDTECCGINRTRIDSVTQLKRLITITF
jgi:hypothetical protein